MNLFVVVAVLVDWINRRAVPVREGSVNAVMALAYLARKSP